MKITLTSVCVDDQAKALAFYVGVLGFVKKLDMELPGGAGRWLTVVSPAAPDGVQLLLEPEGHPAVKVYKSALVKDGIPITSFEVDDVQKEYERLIGRGVAFRTKPMSAGTTTIAVFEDTCGNLIQIHQPPASP
jgi:catechol 2,3-dioxygenase-like lactoylglutathione lyase family enzyme